MKSDNDLLDENSLALERNTRLLLNPKYLEDTDFSEFEKLLELPGSIDQASFSLVQMLDQRKMLREFIIQHMKSNSPLKKLMGANASNKVDEL